MSEQTGNEWQSGDIPAFEAFFRQYERLVFKNAYLLTGTREEADDVLQEVFVSVWRARRTFDPGKGKLTTWLHRITANKCLEMNRKRRVKTTPLEGIDPPAIQTGDDVLVSRQEYEKLMEAMKTLDPKHRAVLVLRYFNDLSYEEIAHAVGIPLGTVKSRINNGLKMLRGQFQIREEGCPSGGEGL
ncbi:MAG: RNA polymerase sigma factor [Dehalococcoidales bacterium]|nr:RNA polymerase sigma factor [Dehalococcoidales bacterium]